MRAKFSWAIVIGFSFTAPGIPVWAAPGSATPGSATLSWYPPTQYADGSALTSLAGYRVYYGRSAKSLNLSIKIDNPGLTRYVVENLSPALWHFAMTSVSPQGKESVRSKTVSKKIT